MDTVQHTSENESVRETTAFHRENKSSSLDRDDLNMNLMRLSTGVKVFPPCFLFTSLSHQLRVKNRTPKKYVSCDKFTFLHCYVIINVDRFTYKIFHD